MLWHAQKWSEARAIQYSTYYAQIAEAEAALARQNLKEGDLDKEGAYYPKISLKTQDPKYDDTMTSLIDRWYFTYFSELDSRSKGLHSDLIGRKFQV